MIKLSNKIWTINESIYFIIIHTFKFQPQIVDTGQHKGERFERIRGYGFLDRVQWAFKTQHSILKAAIEREIPNISYIYHHRTISVFRTSRKNKSLKIYKRLQGKTLLVHLHCKRNMRHTNPFWLGYIVKKRISLGIKT